MKSPKKTSTIQFSLVPEFSWWQSADGKRLMCVSEVHGKGQGNHYINTEVAIIEVGIFGKKRVPYDKFTAQIQNGNLEQVHFVDAPPLVASFLSRANLFK